MNDYQSTARMQRPPRIPVTKHLDVADLERVLEQRRRTSTVLHNARGIGKSEYNATYHTLVSVSEFDRAVQRSFRIAHP